MVTQPVTTPVATTARHVDLGHHAAAQPLRRHLGLDHLADKLVPEDSADVPIPSKDREVGPADPGPLHPNHRFVRFGNGRPNVRNVKRVFENDRAHAGTIAAAASG